MSDDQRRAELSRFLRARRQRLSPEDAGLPRAERTRRRTKGLRREEVAALAGISLPWYTMLEQGKEINVSDQVLDSLARALRLNADERMHLMYLANPRPIELRTKPSDDRPAVSPSLTYLLSHMPLVPAYISDEKLNVLAWNPLASAVFGSFESADRRERNMLWRLFMMPSSRSLFAEWDLVAGSLLGHFRAMYTMHIEDVCYRSFIDELKEGSPEFAVWWDNYEVACISQNRREIAHPRVGKLSLETKLLRIEDSRDRYLNVFIPDPNDGSALRLAELAGEMQVPIST